MTVDWRRVTLTEHMKEAAAVVGECQVVLDFGPDGTMRLRSTHPGVTAVQVQEQTGFPLGDLSAVPQTRTPSEEELRLIREVLDPRGVRDTEVPPA